MTNPPESAPVLTAEMAGDLLGYVIPQYCEGPLRALASGKTVCVPAPVDGERGEKQQHKIRGAVSDRLPNSDSQHDEVAK